MALDPVIAFLAIGISVKNPRKVLSKVTDYTAFLDSDVLCQAAGMDNTKRAEVIQKARQLLESLNQQGIGILLGDAIPEKLRGLEDPPTFLFYRGDIGLLNSPYSIAFIGSRKINEPDYWLAELVVRKLAPRYPVAISGGAIGIDQKCMRTAMAQGLRVISVIGSGIDQGSISTRKICDEVLANGGLVISECFLGEPAAAKNLVSRNRLITGLSDVVIPVVWATKSGTAHGVNFAIMQNKRVIDLHYKQYTPRPQSEYLECFPHTVRWVIE